MRALVLALLGTLACGVPVDVAELVTAIPDPAGLHTPAKVTYPPDDGTAHPLVIALHGYNHSSVDVLDRLGLASARTWAIVVTPDGLHDSTHAEYWNASPACCDHDHRGNDDVAYVQALIDAVPAPEVYVIGQSNGGFLAETVACELAAVTAAIDVAGSSPPSCSRSPSLLRTHGTRDETIAYTGGQMVGLEPYAAAEVVTLQGCSGLGAFGPKIDYDLAINGTESQVAAGVGCDVTFVRMTATHHAPRFGPRWDADATAWLRARM